MRDGENLERHPTAQKLIDVVVEMLKTTPYGKLKSENVLTRSGFSRGPMYHHFQNFDELVELAQLQLYKEYAVRVPDGFLKLLGETPDLQEVLRKLRNPITENLAENVKVFRWQRLGVFERAADSPEFRKKFWEVHEEINQKWMKIYQICLDKGWADPAINPRAFAYLMESTTLARIMDNISPEQLQAEDWVTLGVQLLENLLFKLAL
jgi:AcrR family transcriptional regulator